MNISRLHLIAFLCLPLFLVSCLDDKPKENQVNAEMLKEFQTYMKFKEQDGQSANPQAQNEKSQTVPDKNFAIIEKARDDLRKEFENKREVLARRPADLKMALEAIAKVISERKAMVQEKGSVEEAEKAVSGIVNAYSDILPRIQNIVTLLRCFDMITSNSSAIIEALKQHDNAEIVNQKDAEELWNRVEPALRYSPDSLQLSVKNMFINASKSKFEDKPNIPSYYFFHLMSDILENLKKSHEELNRAAFLRTFENATYAIQKLLSDLDNAIRSDQTAKNTVTFLDEAKKTTMLQLDLIQKRSKEWKEYISSLETLIRRISDIVKDCVEFEKDQSIFDHISTNNPGA